MQSEEEPLIRPPANFSPYEGEKGLDQAAPTVIHTLSHQLFISHRAKNNLLQQNHLTLTWTAKSKPARQFRSRLQLFEVGRQRLDDLVACDEETDTNPWREQGILPSSPRWRFGLV
jgi:hypothetical protein